MEKRKHTQNTLTWHFIYLPGEKQAERLNVIPLSGFPASFNRIRERRDDYLCVWIWLKRLICNLFTFPYTSQAQMSTPFRKVKTESNADLVLWCRPGVTRSRKGPVTWWLTATLVCIPLIWGLQAQFQRSCSGFKLSYNEWVIEQDIT